MFDPRPQSVEDKKYSDLTHAQNMLNLIRGLSQYDAKPLPKYDYGQQATQANTTANALQQTNLINYLLNPEISGSSTGSYAALMRRLGTGNGP